MVRKRDSSQINRSLEGNYVLSCVLCYEFCMLNYISGRQCRRSVPMVYR